ncbi:U4/U6.U5 tri-snRNP-associated protein 2 [Linum grandiflorum]
MVDEVGSSKRQRVENEGSSTIQAIDNPVVPSIDLDENGKSEEKNNEVVRNGDQLEPCEEDCPYLETVNRQVLDFDLKKLCSVSLSNVDVYACLVCGKYYQGRGKNSHAYTHSIEAGHHVYISLQTEKVYSLPDGYEITDPSLDDIRHALNPRFTKEQVEQLDKNNQCCRALDGSCYIPGMVGLNSVLRTTTAFMYVTIQSLMRVTPLRNFFLIPENYEKSGSLLVQRFGELTRKIWHARNCKGQVSPHEFVEAVTKVARTRFHALLHVDPFEFMAWLLATLHEELRPLNNIIYDCFLGELEIFEQEILDDGADHSTTGTDVGENEHNKSDKRTWRRPFLMLHLNLPEPEMAMPQVSLLDILKETRMRRLPKYLIIHVSRFAKSKFVHKNTTPVGFPLKNLDLKDISVEDQKLRSKYDLIANIVHNGRRRMDGFYRGFVQQKSEEEPWYEMQDGRVSETLPEIVAESETYMLIYEQHQY